MFKIGQKVICIDATQNQYLIEGNIYTISGFDNSFFEGVYLAEPETKKHYVAFYVHRFRPLVENKKETDITIFQKLLNSITKELENV